MSPCRRFSTVGDRSRLKEPKPTPSNSCLKKDGDKSINKEQKSEKKVQIRSGGVIVEPPVFGRSRSEERYSSDDHLADGVSFTVSSKAEQQLEALIKDRGYHVKEHVPRKVMEEKILQNIRRRERIAIMMRNEAAEKAGLPGNITTVEELSNQNKRSTEAKTTPPRLARNRNAGAELDPLRLQHVLGLVSKVSL